MEQEAVFTPSEDLKSLQELELENLKVLMDICEKNNLRYYLIGGSLIGVLRHKGFIPWDDDIDVGLPRADYEKFVQVVGDHLPEHMDSKTMTSDPNYKCYFTRLINNKRKIYWDHGQYVAEIGIWMDVFPLDGLPKNKYLRYLHVLHVYVRKALYKFTQIDYVTTNKDRPFVERALIKFAMATHVGKFLDADKQLHKLDRVLKLWDYDKCSWAWNFSGCYGLRELVPKPQLGGTRTGTFEGMEVSIPIESENYLTSIYGNWQELPPPEKRKSHEVSFVEE